MRARGGVNPSRATCDTRPPRSCSPQHTARTRTAYDATRRHPGGAWAGLGTVLRVISARLFIYTSHHRRPRLLTKLQTPSAISYSYTVHGYSPAPTPPPTHQHTGGATLNSRSQNKSHTTRQNTTNRGYGGIRHSHLTISYISLTPRRDTHQHWGEPLSTHDLIQVSHREASPHSTRTLGAE